MWIYKILLCVAAVVYSESRRNALQDYQKTDGVRLVTSRDYVYEMKKNKSVGSCAQRCVRNRRLSFNCRAFNFDQKSKRCYLLSFDSLTAAVDKQTDFNFDLYEKKDYVRECIIGTGVNYKGKRSVTKSGVECQRWDSTIPHEHDFIPRRNKGKKNGRGLRKKDLIENFCRNPDNATTGPWCFTTDPKLRHQGCNIPQCSEVECVTCNGESYRGPMDHTESGRECQRWDLNQPHEHRFHPSRNPDKDLRDNYCRNPNGRLRPWCFTTDPNVPWEYCNIKQCDSDSGSDIETTTKCFHGNGVRYRGTVGVTPEGVICQRWDSQYPHQHPYTPQNYSCKDLRENYCRNPNGDSLPWCFTTDPNVPIAYCTNIPRCRASTAEPEECYTGVGERYQGSQSKTRSGIPCTPWNDRNWNSNMITTGLEGSFCRNPDNDQHGPWCFTENPDVKWDYCSVKPCEALSTSQNTNTGDGRSLSCFIHKRVRIVGGGPIDIRDGSWMVSIHKGNKHWCGGTLVREEWVLTDIGCFSSCVPDLSEYSLWLGTTHFNQSEQSKSRGQQLRIAQLVCGPEGSELALLRLEQPAHFTEYVREIQLPLSDCAMGEGTVCSMYGWGETKGTGHEDTLKMVNLPIVRNEKCKELHRRSIQITEARLCAGGRENEGSCEKDYGGPLVCREGGTKVIVGVNVRGRGCARRDRPGIFVNVAFYAKWIHKVFKFYSQSEI